MNPLFPDDINESEHTGHGQLGHRDHHSTPPKQNQDANPAAELIRRKINALYIDEPAARTEVAAAKETDGHGSKHQRFMYELSTSGKSLAQIQTEWHNYYTQLPDNEKLAVWQEFYQANAKTRTPPVVASQQTATLPMPHMPVDTQKNHVSVSHHTPVAHTPFRGSGRKLRVSDVKKQVLAKVRARNQAQLKARQHLKSLAFGLGVGALALFILLFGFLNEVIIAPFIQPSGKASATPIILSVDGVAPNDTPEIIIPKINVQLPVVYNIPSTSEDVIQKSLESGAIHYPNTAVPGQQGNAAFFGHSSNNIFNKGKYKFAFVLLHELVPGDIFYITYNKKVYAYRVYDKKVVEPNDVWILGNAPGKVATAALITCDPPGTSLRRLVVWGEQINPDPTGNATAPIPDTTVPEALPTEGPTLWGRMWDWIF